MGGNGSEVAHSLHIPRPCGSLLRACDSWDVCHLGCGLLALDELKVGLIPRHLLTQMIIIIRVSAINSADAVSTWHLAWKGVSHQ